jgi:hypothetical protein
MKSSNIISIGNISNLNRNTQEEINLSFLWKVDLIDIKLNQAPFLQAGFSLK